MRNPPRPGRPSPTPPGWIQRDRAAIGAALAAVVPAGQPVALVGFPMHDNIGDSAIWLGTLSALNRTRHRLRYTASVSTYSADDLHRRHPDGPILLHGGGNFGDIWPRHHDFRKRVVRDFPERRIIQMPQTVGYRKADVAADTDVFRCHPDLRILVRDHTSAQTLIGAGLRHVRVCPDMAVELDLAAEPPGDARQPLLFLVRRDKEARTGLGVADLASVAPVIDWPDVIGARPRRQSERLSNALQGRLYSRHGLVAFPPVDRVAACARTSFYRARTQRLVDSGMDSLTRSETIVTDRLHGALLALLGGRRVLAVDRGYGKIASYAEAFLEHVPEFEMVSTFADAVDLHRERSLG